MSSLCNREVVYKTRARRRLLGLLYHAYIRQITPRKFDLAPVLLSNFFFFFRTDYLIPQTFTVTSEHIRFYFLVFLCFTLFSCRFRAVD